MKNRLNAIMTKLKNIMQKGKVRAILISCFALLLICTVTVAWYINNLELWGVQFETGNIEFNAYVYDENGQRLLGPVSSKEEDTTKYINSPLATITNAKVGTTGTAYIALESTGSLGIQYKIALDVTGASESATAYLGGYKYSITKVTNKVSFSNKDQLDVSNCSQPEQLNDEIVTIDRNPITGTIEERNGYDIYRFDYTLVHKNEEYTGKAINIYYNIFATQIGGDFEDTEERGYTYYCSTKEDIDRAKVEAYVGDTIKLSSDIVYYGDLVFNKPIHLETNDFTLTVNGNLMYDYVLGYGLKIDAGGLGRIVVQCTKEGVGGNFTIKAPISDVTLSGSHAAIGDIVVEKKFTVDATNSFGSPGVSFNNIRIVDSNNTNKTVLLESNTRATVSFGTTIGRIQSVGKANNIEIVNNGVIDWIDLSNMYELPQTNSPQIYILNNDDINNPIALPDWSKKFVENESGCTGNTRIIQSISGSPMTVTGKCQFGDGHIEVEKKNVLVEQMEEGNDSRLKIYYQDLETKTTTIQSILEDYFKYEVTTNCTLNEVLQLEIISISDKAITAADIKFMNSNSMQSLKILDMQRAHVCDYDAATETTIPHKLPASAYSGVDKYDKLVLPQDLHEIGKSAFYNSNINSIITIPSDVTVFGSHWFYNGQYVNFAASIPVAEAAAGLIGVKAIFVDEAYIGSYKSVYTQYVTQIYPVSVFDEAKQHFVRNTKADEWEITYYIRGDETQIGENITIDGTNLKITSVYDHAYLHNFKGTEVRFADTVEDLGEGNFYSNKGITYVDLNCVKSIGDNVFYSCTNLKEVDFGDFLETIGTSAFNGCVSLAQDVVLPATMEQIGSSAFRQTKITSVNTGGATSVDDYAFYSCTALIYAELPNVKTVGESGQNLVFQSCSSLVSVRMPVLIKVSGKGMFEQCTSLRELYMASNDDGISLGGNPFYGVDGSKLKLFVPEKHLAFYQKKCPGGISATIIYPEGEKMGEELINGFNIGEYIVSDNGDNTYTLITSNIDYVDSLVVPEAYNGKAITEIFANAFRNQNFTDVKLEIGNNIEYIGQGAFYGCSGICEVEFGTALETIASYAFSHCSGLSQKITLPASMRVIGSYAFSNSGILAINTGGTTLVDDGAFKQCAELIYAELPEVTVVAESGSNEIFSTCASLVSADMPKLAKAAGRLMFGYCTALTEIYMGSKDPNISLGANAFYGANANVIKLFVPEELVSFYQGRNILSAGQVYPRGEKLGTQAVNGFTIGDYILLENEDGYTLVTSNLSFEGDVALPSAFKGKPITQIYANAFRNQSFTDVSLTLGDQVTVIGDNAFYGLEGLGTITMDQVTTVGANAFYGSGLKVLSAPQLTYVGNAAFRKCQKLEVVHLPKLANINSDNAFAECTALKSVYFENVMFLSKTTFSGCKKLERITINRIIDSDGGNMPSVMTIESTAPCKIYVPYRTLSAYPSTWSGKPVVTFDTTASHNGDTYILAAGSDGRYALIDFMPSKTVTALTLPASVSTDSGENVSIYAIDFGAFSTVSGTLKDITLSASVGQIHADAFCECTVLENILVDGSNPFFTSINGILYSKDQKMLVKYPVGRKGALDLSSSDYAQTVGIGSGAFAGAGELTQIRFPSTLLVIDGGAFRNCGKLHTVQFTGNTPPVLMGSGIFDTGVENFKMLIPTESADVIAAYYGAYNFGEYQSFMDLGGSQAPDGTGNGVPLAMPAAMNTMLEAPGSEEEKGEDPAQEPSI